MVSIVLVSISNARLLCSHFAINPRKFQYYHNAVAHILPNTMVLTFTRPSYGSSWNTWLVAQLLTLYVISLLCWVEKYNCLCGDAHISVEFLISYSIL